MFLFIYRRSGKCRGGRRPASRDGQSGQTFELWHTSQSTAPVWWVPQGLLGKQWVQRELRRELLGKPLLQPDRCESFQPISVRWRRWCFWRGAEHCDLHSLLSSSSYTEAENLQATGESGPIFMILFFLTAVAIFVGGVFQRLSQMDSLQCARRAYWTVWKGGSAIGSPGQIWDSGFCVLRVLSLGTYLELTVSLVQEINMSMTCP